jgi:hypothetical protein
MRDTRNKKYAHLGRQDEARERGAVDPRELVQDRQGGQDPVAVTNLFSRTVRRGYSRWSAMSLQKSTQTDVHLPTFRGVR